MSGRTYLINCPTHGLVEAIGRNHCAECFEDTKAVGPGIMETYRVTLDIGDTTIHQYNVSARSHEEAYNRVIDEMKIPETKVISANIRRLENK